MSIVMNYEAMFGGGSELVTDRLLPEILPVTIRESVIKKACGAARKKKTWLLIFVVGTKPCFYKFWGSIAAAEEKGLPYFIVNAGQHYDSLLTYGSKEFGYDDRIAVNLSIRGDLAQKAGEIVFKMGWLAKHLKKTAPDVTSVPVVLGDTILTNTVPMAWMYSIHGKAIHNEAGLRSMSPSVVRNIAKNIAPNSFVERQISGGWELMNIEPFPEQYDTFTASAGCEFLFAPMEINRQHLLREGYRPENIFVIGGAVVDALELKLKEKPSKSIFSTFPVLADGEWIRVDIHRKENLTRRRLGAIVGAVADLVKKKYRVNFVEMNATRIALEQFGIKNDLLKLRKHRNFLYTPIWQEYAQVIEFYRSPHCLLALTDSGGLQEELNMIGKPCLTRRFNTDRPETIIEGRGNLLVPPFSGDFIVRMVEHVVKSESLFERMHRPKRLYGTGAGREFIDIVAGLARQRKKMFTWSHERLGLWREK